MLSLAVVHLEHGIGVYKGLETLKINNETNDFLKIIYKKDDVLYVPVHQINLISKYQALNTDVVPLSHLGTDKWSQEKEKALKRIRDVAAELLDIYAKRALKQGFAMTKLGEDDKKFAEEFNFELTPDQARAIDEIINDLIVAAYNDARVKLKKKTSEELMKVAGVSNLPFDFKLPF